MLRLKTPSFLITLISILFILNLNPYIYSQSTFVKPTEKGFNLLLDIPQFKYREIKKGNYSQKDFFEFTDEASPGTLKLPKISILLAIPSESKPEIVVINKDYSTRKHR